MKKNNSFILLLLFVLLNIQVVYPSSQDSIFIERLLRKSYSMDFSTNEEKLLFFAGAFQGVPYKGGTLDAMSEESLVVRTDSLDCTTYVETVAALFLASKNSSACYDDFCNSLRLVRYRGGVIEGYVSRLHYFSDWVSDNCKKGILYEITENMEHLTKRCPLDYMTSHQEAYKQLEGNPENVSGMKVIEESWYDYKMPYVPKEKLANEKNTLDIDNGDILALTTSIEGLDVVHLGFAYWIDGKLHMLHASSLKKKVILDEESLYDYMMKRDIHTGVRVVRLN